MFFNNISFILRGYVIFGGLKIGCSKSTESYMNISVRSVTTFSKNWFSQAIMRRLNAPNAMI